MLGFWIFLNWRRNLNNYLKIFAPTVIDLYSLDQPFSFGALENITFLSRSLESDYSWFRSYVQHIFLLIISPYIRSFYYRPQRSCGQGNVFTGVCLSTGGGGGEGVCLSACWDTRLPSPRDQADPPPGPGISPPGPGRHPPGTRQTPPRPGRHPPGKQTAAYGLRAAGTHPTGMHSC